MKFLITLTAVLLLTGAAAIVGIAASILAPGTGWLAFACAELTLGLLSTARL